MGQRASSGIASEAVNNIHRNGGYDNTGITIDEVANAKNVITSSVLSHHVLHAPSSCHSEDFNQQNQKQDGHDALVSKLRRHSDSETTTTHHDELNETSAADCHSNHGDSSHNHKCRPYVIQMEEIVPSSASYIGDKVVKKTAEFTDPDDAVADHNDPYSIERFSSLKVDEDKFKTLPKQVRKYYKYQDELINAYEDMNLDVVDAMELNDQKIKLQNRAILMARISLGCNVMLLIAKAAAAALSGSISIISSVMDSAVDLVCGATLWWSNRAIKKRNIYKYPQGRTKLEPVVIIALAVLMSVASIEIIIQSIERIIAYAGGNGTKLTFGIDSIVICACTVGLKLCLFLLCKRIDTPTTQVLALDHRNDVCSNSVALVCGLIGSKYWNYLDPIGAILICGYIIFNWSRTGREQVKLLTGYTAQPDFLKKITWLAVNHNPDIQKIDTIRAFHFGNNFLVEVHLVLPKNMSVQQSHDIGESLQVKLEHLPDVERAFVHVDYETDHHPHDEHIPV